MNKKPEFEAVELPAVIVIFVAKKKAVAGLDELAQGLATLIGAHEPKDRVAYRAELLEITTKCLNGLIDDLLKIIEAHEAADEQAREVVKKAAKESSDGNPL